MENEELLTPQDGTQEEQTPETNFEPEQETPETPEETPEEPDYKTKFTESTREAQILAQKLKEKDELINNLTSKSLPTEDEIKQAYPEWENYSPEVQIILKNQHLQNKEILETRKMMLDMTEEKRWQEDLGKVLTDPAFDKLKGKEEEFKKFVYKPTHKGVSLETLAKAFLFEVKEPRQVNKAPTLEKGSAGLKTMKPAAMTAEEVAEIRTKDYPRYVELLRTGKIKASELI